MADLLLIQIYKTTEHILKYITEFKFVRCVCDMLQSNYKIEMNVFINHTPFKIKIAKLWKRFGEFGFFSS